jgi:hypothetical protein
MSTLDLTLPSTLPSTLLEECLDGSLADFKNKSDAEALVQVGQQHHPTFQWILTPLPNANRPKLFRVTAQAPTAQAPTAQAPTAQAPTAQAKNAQTLNPAKNPNHMSQVSQMKL